MNKFLILFPITLVVAAVTFFVVNSGNQDYSFLSPLAQKTPTPTPLMAYTFENLKQTHFPQNNITLGRQISSDTGSSSQMFYYSVPKSPNSSEMEKVSGLLNLPKKSGVYPVIVMFRGFVPSEIFKSGIGTQPSAKFFADSGLITIAPDFLGFGESASPSGEAFENRFQTYTTALTLLSSLPTLNNGLEASFSGTIKADLSKIGIWGHSNGGHIALSTLAISGVSYPTVLWAPVTKSFPYSILYYTDESDDQGKSLRKVLSNFEEIYDTETFSLEKYYSWIKAPIEIHQGTADQEVPVWWSDEFVASLKKDNIEVKYITHPGADHNLRPDGWSTAVQNSLDFYLSRFSSQ